jgi:hypothetical protein
MACSYCEEEGHNKTSCIRRIFDETWEAKAAAMIRRCRKGDGLLAHLYWPKRVGYFFKNLPGYVNRGPWTLKATPGHGIAGTQRPSLNFFVADGTFGKNYIQAARARGFIHGILFRRSGLGRFEAMAGHEFQEVTSGYPGEIGSVDEIGEEDSWRYDYTQGRAPLLGDLAGATVARLATQSRTPWVRIGYGDTVALW